MIAKNTDGGDPERGRDLPRQELRFLGKTVVGEIAAEQQHVRLGGCSSEKRLQAGLSRLLDVQVGNRGDAQSLFHLVPSISIPAVQCAISSAVMFPIGRRRASL